MSPGPPSAPGASGTPAERAAWRRRTAGERRWPVATGITLAIVLQLVLPSRFGLQPTWVLPALEAVMLAGLVIGNPDRLDNRHPALRYGSLGLVALISVSNAASAFLLIDELVHARGPAGEALPLLASGAAIYVTNVIAFALWYWELDRGGPVERTYGEDDVPDFLFPQMTSPHLAPPEWEPLFIDYLYVSFTNATAFSPTDTLPMSRWAKALMALQSSVALLTAALVVARAVNILG